MNIHSTTTIVGSLLFSCAGVCQGQTPAAINTPDSSGYSIVQRRPHSRVWQRTLLNTNDAGIVTTNCQSYTEIGTGICYLSNGQYVDSVEAVEPVAGGAQAVQGRCQVQWALNANTPGGAVSVTTADAKQLSSTVFGLVYFDTASGSNAAIGQLKDCNGAIVPPNQVVYADAFSNVTADIWYTYTKAGLTQDILVRSSLPPPDAFGLADESSVLEIWTEFFNSPEPEATTVTNGSMTDTQILDFGDMKMGVGHAFFLNGQDGPVPAGLVTKQWILVNNRTFLIESIGYSTISNLIQQFPLHTSNLRPGRGSVGRMALLDPPPARRAIATRAGKPMKLAQAETRGPRLDIDYVLLSSTNILTLQGDQTYLATSLVNVTGTVYIESGTIVKYTNSGSPEIVAADFNCPIGPYKEGVFTSMNDNSVGAVISGSTGAPSSGAGTYLDFGTLTQPLVISNLRFSYANQAIGGLINSLQDASIEIMDCQFINCDYAFYSSVEYNGSGGLPFYAYNNLFSKCNYAFFAKVLTGYNGYLSVSAVNVTADQVGSFMGGTGGSSCYATNSLFTSVTNQSAVSFTSCCTNSSSAGIYTNVGAGGYYLATGSTNHNAGTTSINSALLADLETLTTYPPILISNATFGSSTNLAPQACRDTNWVSSGGGPDLGYHYAVLDYEVSQLCVTNGTLTILPGTAIATVPAGVYGGIAMEYSAGLLSQGTPTHPNWIVAYNLVQEAPLTSAYEAPAAIEALETGTNTVRFRFMNWSMPAGGSAFVGSDGNWPLYGAEFEDCQLYGGQISSSTPGLAFTNCLFQRVNVALTNVFTNCAVVNTFYNNLFFGGAVGLGPGPDDTWTFADNLFDETTNTLTGTINVCSHNAYVTTNYGFLTPTNGAVFLTNSPAFQTGALGAYYYPASLTSLIHAGSRSAAAAGLYHYTVTTNNVIEGANTVSIGFHYIAVDTNGNPLDYNGDGLPDYVKDSNGDGVYDSGDLANWLSPFNIYDQGTYAGSLDPGHLRLGYWRFNTPALTNEAGLRWISNIDVSMNNSWSGSNVSLNNANSQLAYPVTSNGQTYLNCANGTVRFWYQPNWSSTNSANSNALGAYGAYFLSAVDSSSNSWSLWVLNVTNSNHVYIGSTILFASGCIPYGQPYSFNTGGINGALLQFQANLWYQIALTYSPTNVALYTNGVLLATATFPNTVSVNGCLTPMWEMGDGIIYYPPASNLTSFAFGNELGQPVPVMGQLDELETFNYPLTAQQVGAGYPYFGGNPTNMQDSRYVGRSDMLQKYVDGSPANVVQCRLGYWRFDTPELTGEQGQVPISQSGVTVVPSWSGMAASIGSGSGSQITYPDVGSNGWANINCRQGSLRFWYKPSTSAGTGPFVFLGSSNSAGGGAGPALPIGDSTEEWMLELSGGTSISFVTKTNGVAAATNLMATCNLTNPNKWTQIVLTYGSDASTLYMNGSPVITGLPVTRWPSLANRQLGMVIGNSTAHTNSLNGQFEEMETFNYELAAGDIAANFQLVTNVDSDLNGIPDLLEDIQLAKARPFLGAPVVITGTIEAEQFDMGGTNVGYYTSNTALNTVYRPTKMVINPVTNDACGGYCLDQTHAGDWTQYTLNVLVPQTYMVDVRAEAIGASTGGVFQCTFTNGMGVVTSGAFSNSTPPLSMTSTNWTDITNVVYLTNGTYAMKLQCLTNASGANTVGRFNYISIYPWWPPPTNGLGSSNVPINTASTNNPNGLVTSSNFFSASNNAYWIQQAVDALSPNGGTVTIPTGTWYVSQAEPNDANDAYTNAAVCITNSNITITSTNTNATNTMLIANNRSTTVFVLGESSTRIKCSCTNFTLSSLTLEAQPHEVAFPNPTNGYTNFYELGQLALASGQTQGSLAVFYGWASNRFTVNICVSNCVFLHGIKSLVPGQYISNFMVVNCLFIPMDANCYFTGITNNPPTNTLYTTNWQGGNVGIMGNAFNAVFLENIHIGNAALTTTNTNVLYVTNWPAPDGFVWLQICGNIFLGRNTISNYALEGVQLDAGPNAVVGNTYGTLVSDGSCCALCAINSGWAGLTGSNVTGYSTCFIGNSVYGGRSGEEAVSAYPFTINFSGNSLNLFPPFDATNDWPAAAVWVQNCQAANVCGNTLVAGSRGFWFNGPNTGALILNNSFGSAAYCGIGYGSTGDSLGAAQIYGNTLGEGVNFHVQLPLTNSFGWFLGSNTYWDIHSNSVPLFTDPAASAVHIFN